MKRSPEQTATFLEANRLRMEQNPTLAERKLWEHLEPLGGWERQRVILVPLKPPAIQDRPFILDFFHPGRNLCVEVDGDAHRHRVNRDRMRDQMLRQMGVRTLRFSNGDVLHRLDQTLEAIREACCIQSKS